MKVYLKTVITPEIKVYDSADQSQSGLLVDLLRPVVLVKDDSGAILYAYGNEGTSWISNIPDILLLGAAFFGAFFILKKWR
uniref:Uncharacterized protein n=1 Tax=viral metagenome TaxID=1070528 RepID=A0A6H1Z7T3_9ZZZZ